MREPYAVKIASTVPGRGEGGNTFSLFDEGTDLSFHNDTFMDGGR